MTREEAIHILDNLKPTNTKSSFDAYIVGKALTMAVNALEQNESAEKWYKLFVEKLDEQEPCEDAISREDAIKALQKVACYSASVRARMIGAIEELPSVTQKSETVTEFADRCRECGARYGKLLKHKSEK